MTSVYFPSKEWDEREGYADPIRALYDECAAFSRYMQRLERKLREIDLSLSEIDNSAADIEWKIDEMLEVEIPRILQQAQEGRQEGKNYKY